MSSDNPFSSVLTAAQVGTHLGGLSAETIRRYVWESGAPGRRYSDHPFPPPAGRVGRTPYWTEEQVPDLEAWLHGRKGQGVGGGRKPRRPVL